MQSVAYSIGVAIPFALISSLVLAGQWAWRKLVKNKDSEQ